jgi:putative cofactor-binding repeat protein
MNAGITLKAGQKLIGEGVGLASPLIAAGAAPVISNVSILGGNIPVVVLAGGNEVAGIQVSGAGAGNSVGIQGVGVAGFNIHDNVLDGLEREGILLSNASGTGVIANNTFSNLTGANAGNAIDYITTAAGVSLGINDNDFNNIAETCMRVRFDAGGGTVSVTGNTLTTAVASNAGSRGIDVDASLTSVVSSTISNNIVGSAASTQINRSGIQVNASNGGTHRSAVSGNTVENAGADGSAGIEVQAADLVASSVCLQLTGNTSSTGLGYSLDNRDGGTLQAEGADLAALQAANTGTFDVPAPGIVTFVAPGTCGL